MDMLAVLCVGLNSPCLTRLHACFDSRVNGNAVTQVDVRRNLELLLPILAVPVWIWYRSKFASGGCECDE